MSASEFSGTTGLITGGRADISSSVPIAASILLDIFNIFLFFLELFGNGRD